MITSFTVIDNDGTWILKGTVTDGGDSVAGLKVHFGGILAKYDLTATVLANGTFSESKKIPKGCEDLTGEVTALTHAHGKASNLAEQYLT